MVRRKTTARNGRGRIRGADGGVDSAGLAREVSCMRPEYIAWGGVPERPLETLGERRAAARRQRAARAQAILAAALETEISKSNELLQARREEKSQCV